MQDSQACPRRHHANAPVAKSSDSAADEPDEAEAGYPPSDPILRESERILADYVAMLHHPPTVAMAAH